MTALGYIYFYACAAFAVAGALATVSARNPIRGAIGLLVTIVSIAGLFLSLHAEFLAIIQLIVYAGAIVVLFIFVIMLLGPSATSARDHRGRVTRTIGGTLFGLASLFAVYLAVRPGWGEAHRLASVPADFGSIDAVGKVLYTADIGPFELSSALLMIAIIGAVAVARGRHQTDQPLAARKEGSS